MLFHFRIEMVVQQAVIERKLHVKLSNEGAMSITI